MDVVDKFKTKVGPLPIYGWVLIIGGAIIVARWYLARSSSNSSAITDTGTGETSDPLADDSGLTSDETEADSGTNPDSGTTTTATPTTVTYSSDLEWTAAAQRELDAQGYQPAAVATALVLYLGDQSLNAQQYAIVELALTNCGTPPEGAHAVTLAKPSTPGTTTTKTPSPVKTSPVTAKPSTVTPATPGGFALKANGGTTIVASWKDNGAAKYQVTNMANQVAGVTTQSPLTITGRTPGKTYVFHLRAIGSNGKGSNYTLPHTIKMPAAKGTVKAGIK